MMMKKSLKLKKVIVMKLKSSRFHSTSIDLDINYDFYEDMECEDEDNKSGISSNSSLNEELDFGRGKK